MRKREQKCLKRIAVIKRKKEKKSRAVFGTVRRIEAEGAAIEPRGARDLELIKELK